MPQPLGVIISLKNLWLIITTILFCSAGFLKPNINILWLITMLRMTQRIIKTIAKEALPEVVPIRQSLLWWQRWRRYNGPYCTCTPPCVLQSPPGSSNLDPFSHSHRCEQFAPPLSCLVHSLGRPIVWSSCRECTRGLHGTCSYSPPTVWGPASQSGIGFPPHWSYIRNIESRPLIWRRERPRGWWVTSLVSYSFF